MHVKKRYILRSVLTIIGIIVFLGIAFTLEQYYRLHISNFRSIDQLPHSYYIYPGASIDSVLDLVSQDYDIGSRRDFDLHARAMRFNNPEPGHYTFPEQLGNREFINRLKFGFQTPITLTWNNFVRTREDLAGKIGSRLYIDSLVILERLESDDYMAQFGMNKETSRCLFIPNSYEVYWNITVDQLFERMYKEYNSFWTDERRAKAEAIGLTPIEVAIIASIVEGESHNKNEMPIIASLYINRVHKGMLLQACPTVKYAVGDFKLRRILYRHLAVDSPYNTYKYPGLPPGPIRCPAPTTLDMVLNAPKTDYLFMCASPELNNTHIFSSSYSSHAAAAVQYRHTMDTINWENYDARKAKNDLGQQ
ncbi:MAG: endolytic transglycosylase MltG [Paludibacteraceae bacterium]|nr:endolytic transglycosylase MltG [Paludibacteraceae bacterium]